MRPADGVMEGRLLKEAALSVVLHVAGGVIKSYLRKEATLRAVVRIALSVLLKRFPKLRKKLQLHFNTLIIFD